MRQNTYTAQAVEAVEDKINNDKACKKILASEEILAYILKGVVPEYGECSSEEIAKQYIEPNEVFGTVPVAPGLTGKREYIEGMQQEDGIPGEATVFFDVKFRVLLPGSQRSSAQICLYVDMEAQNRYRPGYPLEKRGIYYLSRLISSQIQKVSEDTDYGILQKCYSIWLCMGNDIPKREQQSITRYFFKKEDVYGVSNVAYQDYDMMGLVILRLGEYPTEEKTLGMLQTLFLGSMIPEERLKKLEEKYQLNISEEIGEEVRNMCSYSQVIEDRGMKKGMEKGMEKGILIYRTLLETKSIQQTAAKTKEPADKVRKIAEQYDVEVSE